MRESRVSDSSRPCCPKCDSKMHGVRVDIGSIWTRCPKCGASVYLIGCMGGVTFLFVVTGPEYQRLANAGMLPRDVLQALGVIGQAVTA